MTRRERLLVKRAKEMILALERCVRWEGTGGRREQHAQSMLAQAEARWRTTLKHMRQGRTDRSGEHRV